MTSRSHVPRTLVASLEVVPGAATVDARSRGSPAARGRAASRPPLACGLALIRRSPERRELEDLRPAAGRRRRTAPRGDSSAASASSWARCSGFVADVGRAGPGASARCPRPACRRPPSGRSSPSGVRRTIIGQAGPARRSPAARARAGWRRSSSRTASIVSAISACTAIGSSPATNRRRVAVALEAGAISSSSGIRARIVGLAIL